MHRSTTEALQGKSLSPAKKMCHTGSTSLQRPESHEETKDLGQPCCLCLIFDPKLSPSYLERAFTPDMLFFR